MKLLLKIFIFLFCFAQIIPALAANYEVEIKQINPESWNYTKTCSYEEQPCHVFMGITPQHKSAETDDLELDIGIVFKDNGAYFQFKSGWAYLFLEDNKNYFFKEFKDEKFQETVKLFVRHPMAKDDPTASRTSINSCPSATRNGRGVGDIY